MPIDIYPLLLPYDPRPKKASLSFHPSPHKPDLAFVDADNDDEDSDFSFVMVEDLQGRSILCILSRERTPHGPYDLSATATDASGTGSGSCTVDVVLPLQITQSTP